MFLWMEGSLYLIGRQVKNQARQGKARQGKQGTTTYRVHRFHGKFVWTTREVDQTSQKING